MNPGLGVLHVLYSLRAEGCPRLALALLREERRRTGTVGAVAVAVANPLDLAAEVDALGAPILSLGWRPRGFVSLVRRTAAVLDELRPRGVVCYTVGMHVSVAVAARLRRIPIVVHLGNAAPARARTRRLIRAQMQAGRPFVTRHAACSDHVRADAVRAYGLPEASVVTVPNGIDVDRFVSVRQQRRDRPPREGLLVGMVASLETHKDQATLLAALAEMRRRGVSGRVRLVGSGEREPMLRDLAVRLDVADAVEWTGVLHDVTPALADLDVFAYSVTAEEGLGIALVEALAAGVPIVASDVGACREVLDGGRYGTLVARQDPVAWADALLAHDRRVAPVAAVSRYDLRAMADAYDILLGGSNGPPVPIRPPTVPRTDW